MLTNYIKIAVRVLLRRKFFTFVSLFGITFTLLVLLIVTAMLEHVILPTPVDPARGRTMYVNFMTMFGDNSSWNGKPGFGFLDRYCRDLPGVETMSIVSEASGTVTYLDGERIELDRRRTDGSYWKIYDHEWLEGAPYTSEDDESGLHVAVISRQARERLLDGDPAVGRRVNVGNSSYEVVGVVEDVSLAADMAYSQVWVPMGTLTDPAVRTDLMGGYSAILVANDADDFDGIREDFQARLAHVEFPNPDHYHTMRGRPVSRVELIAGELGSEDDEDAVRTATMVGMALAIGFMLLPAINLVSVSLSRIYERASEIGVRKAFGAPSKSLVLQFVFENVVLCVVGGVLAFLLAGFLLAAFNQTGILPHADFAVNVRVFLVGLMLATIFGVASGAYPAFRMSRFHPVEALRGGVR